MRTRWIAPALAALLLSLVAAAARTPPPAVQVANVEAFARLYGVVRYFHPGDGGAVFDWNRFAVLGVSEVRMAQDPQALRVLLRRLFAPLGPGIEVGDRLPSPSGSPPAVAAEALVAWRYLGPGFPDNALPGPYRGKRTHRAASAAIDGFVAVAQTLPADSLRGKAIRFRGQARASGTGTAAATGLRDSGALWLRVDLPGKKMGFFDNMSDRPIREAAWRRYEIEGPVAADAISVVFGVMASGAVTADFDAIELAVKEADGSWMVIPVPDSGFEAADGAGRPWRRTGTSREAALSRPGEGAPEGRQYLRLAPPSSGGDELFPESPPVAGSRVEFDLGSGLRARVRTVLTDREAKAAPDPDSLEVLKKVVAAIPGPSGEPSVDRRLADVVVAWNALLHFYPYWSETGIRWDALLAPQLESARAAGTRSDHHRALRLLVAAASDGHGSVADTLDRATTGWLPLQLKGIGGRLVVSASSAPEVPVGAVVTAIDGLPAETRLKEAMSIQSGTEGWRVERAASELVRGPNDSKVLLAIDDGAGPRTISLSFAGKEPPAARRPEEITETEPGIWYVDLTRVSMERLTPALVKIASARGVVFDLRGYPTDAGAGILRHLLSAPESDRWMHVAKIVGPFGEVAGWQSFGWDLAPASPRISGKVLFLTDGSAISYAESVMGYVADRKLGTVVGSRTAGTNGNVASFSTPGGFQVHFTGMRVTGHDGKSVRHLAGIRPDVAAEPTVEGLRAGRDEVLERGLAEARRRAAVAPPPK